MNKFRSKKLIIVVSWATVLLWMLLIFNLSAQVREESNNLSKGLTEVVVEAVKKVAPDLELDLDSLNHVIRKNAHFFAYLILGILALNAMRKSGYDRVKWTLLICILYAISDEIHQAFVPGRGPQVWDVFIDSAGAFTGVSVYWIISRIKKIVIKTKKRF